MENLIQNLLELDDKNFNNTTEKEVEIPRLSKATGKNVAAFLKVYSSNTEIGHWGSNGIWIGKGSITLGSKASSATKYKNASGTDINGYYPVEINNDGSALFKYATITTGSTIGKSKIDANGVIGNYGTTASMAGMKIGDGTFGISAPNRFDNSKWCGISFGYESRTRYGLGNSSLVISDGLEMDGDWSQGGFFVVHAAPNQGLTGTYTKQLYDGFYVASTSSTKAWFNVEHYNKWEGRSDERVKDDIEDIDVLTSLDFIMNLKPKSFRFNENSGIKNKTSRHSGFIAQDVQKLLEPNNGMVERDDEDSFYNINYNEIIPHLVNVIKKQQEELSSLKEKINGKY